MAIVPTKNFMAKPVIYVKWPTVYFLCFKFELNLSINKFKSAINCFFSIYSNGGHLGKVFEKMNVFGNQGL